ncbi:hypothetical protein [Chromobacterium haemolyticum]|uniref:hypothetical protein n=1 Tax=Chromobacterium TaxID=535 RepID=UPI004055B750
MQAKTLTISDEDGNVVFESPSFEPIHAGAITARVQFDSATAEARINALVEEYPQPVSEEDMAALLGRATTIAVECMDVQVATTA